jgi:hypothetical protein
MRNRQGFMAVDMIFGIIIVAIITAVLLGTVRHERNAEAALADSRGAMHLAEHAMLNLQHNQPLPIVSSEMQLKVQPAGDGVAPAGFGWAKIEATVHGHHRSLLGIVPTQSLPGGTR